MNLSPIARRALSHIEWGRAEPYTTNKGKTRIIRTGIPTKPFWRWYKTARDELQAIGVTIRPNGTQAEFSRKTGRTVQRKLWEATAWRADILDGMGI